MKRLIVITLGIALLTVVSGNQSIADDSFKENDLYFSTEEDFVSADSSGVLKVISDGDLLSWQGVVFMKNQELLKRFEEKNDLGLDAVDVVYGEKRLVVFSTELDSTHGFFTAGDLLATNGARISNMALLFRWQFQTQPADLGLDAVQFRGEQEAIIKFLEYVASKGWNYYDDEPERLAKDLAEYTIDIWFSTEGTAPFNDVPMFLDGDLLSVLHGTVVIHNSNLLPLSVPAGIPKRGVDFGLDAVMCPRFGKEPVYFSTEILFNNDQFPFTDGDLLLGGAMGIIIQNFRFIEKFKPRVDFLGLDAVSYFEK